MATTITRTSAALAATAGILLGGMLAIPAAQASEHSSAAVAEVNATYLSTQANIINNSGHSVCVAQMQDGRVIKTAVLPPGEEGGNFYGKSDGPNSTEMVLHVFKDVDSPHASKHVQTLHTISHRADKGSGGKVESEFRLDNGTKQKKTDVVKYQGPEVDLYASDFSTGTRAKFSYLFKDGTVMGKHIDFTLVKLSSNPV